MSFSDIPKAASGAMRQGAPDSLLFDGPKKGNFDILLIRTVLTVEK